MFIIHEENFIFEICSFSSILKKLITLKILIRYNINSEYSIIIYRNNLTVISNKDEDLKIQQLLFSDLKYIAYIAYLLDIFLTLKLMIFIYKSFFR
jgi:hypothetical protein